MMRGQGGSNFPQHVNGGVKPAPVCSPGPKVATMRHAARGAPKVVRDGRAINPSFARWLLGDHAVMVG